MSGTGKGKTKSAAMREIDEVELLLKAAQDDLLLNLSVNSHTVRGGGGSGGGGFSNLDSLDSELSRRFQALKSRPAAPSQPTPKPSPQNQTLQSDPLPNATPIDDELKGLLGDDLSARFARLRGSINPSPSVLLSGPSHGTDNLVTSDSDVNEEDEVEKIIQWAKDAARLDPSPLSDDEFDTKDDDIISDIESSSDEDEEDIDEKTKKVKKGKVGKK